MSSLLRKIAHYWLIAAQWLGGPGRSHPIVGPLLRFIEGAISFAGAFFSLLMEICTETIWPLIKRLKPNSLTTALPLLVSVFGLLFILLILINPGGNDPEPLPDPETVIREDRATLEIGALLSLTGKNERIGNEMRRGYDLALEAVNSNGGVILNDVPYNLGLVIYDDESSPVRATETAELLFSIDQPRLLLAPYSSLLAQPAIRVAREHETPVVVPVASSAGLGTQQNGVFNLQTPPGKQLMPAAEIFVKHLAEKKRSAHGKGGKNKAEKLFANGEEPRVAIVSSNDVFAQEVIKGAISVLAEGGVRDLIVIDPSLADEEFSTAAEALASIDGMFISAYADGALRVFEEIGEHSYNIPFIALTHCTQARIIQSQPTVAEGALCAVDWLADAQFPGSGSLASGFASAYRKEHGSDPGYHAAAAAAAVQIIADSIKRLASNDGDLSKALSRTNIRTFYGPIKFGNGGINTAKPMVLAQVSQSRYVPVAPPAIAKQQINFNRPQLASSK